ncbi:TcpQ domain-containing protein [Dickeya zeae]|nr:TcpQ domain-containing protein [Dickeya zeae]
MHVIPVISTKGGEGKSTQAANLAGFLADAGLITLLIDGDYSQPTASSIYALEYEAPFGLFELLMQTADLGQPDTVISRTVIKNLDLIISNDPDDRLSNAMLHAPDGRMRLRNILQHPSFQKYDVIIIDSKGAAGVMVELVVLAATESVLGVIKPILPDVREFNPNQKISANSASNVAPKASTGAPHVPTTALPPAPAAQPQPVRQTVTPVAVSAQPAPAKTASALVPAAQTGPTWKADVGSTLKETLMKWAAQAKCDTNGGNWVVIWPVAVDYRIDAPLSFHGNFESVLVQIFDLYRRAEKPLFAEASRMQCLVSVSDTPVSGAGR